MIKDRRKKMSRWTPDKIKELRAAYGRTQADFSHELLGVTVTTLANWEQGRGKPTGSAEKLLDRLEKDWQQGKIPEAAGASRWIAPKLQYDARAAMDSIGLGPNKKSNSQG
jgi:DNA-binding XRE family transcriptional regulator